jgi:predicted phosphodiesterase
MLVAVISDAHAHAEALDAVIGAADARGAEEIWSLGDMVGGGPDPQHAVARTRDRCTLALVGNHDYGGRGSVDPSRFGEPGSPAVRSIELACARLGGADLEWLRARKPAGRRDGVQCWHGSPRNAVHEYVGPANAGPCLAAQRAPLGLVGHTHVAAAWQQTPGGGARRVKIRPGEPLDVSAGRWLLNPGAVGAPAAGAASARSALVPVAPGAGGAAPSAPARRATGSPRLGWWDALEAQAGEGAFWLMLDLTARTATWRQAPFDPAPARRRARGLGLDDGAPPPPHAPTAGGDPA